ncbi:MAG: outer membrane beta-barrel protein [Alphaproteobacteria bacterium]|nr:outer membrane beta-barrel protein [Alphaproteobacteria bacterium]
MKKILLAALVFASVAVGAETTDTTTKASDTAIKTRWYIGAGLSGNSSSVDLKTPGIGKIATFESSSGGININGGVRIGEYFRTGLNISSTSGSVDQKVPGLGKVADEDFTSTIVAAEFVGIIPVSQMVELEAGLSIGRLSYSLDLSSDIIGLDEKNHTLVGLLLGCVVNFTENHALTIAFKGSGYSGSSINQFLDPVKYDGTVSEFQIGYRYTF